jgi:uncharacterized protein
MAESFFVSDLHGRADRYEKLFGAVASSRPAAVFLGGDLLPHPMSREYATPDGGGFLEAVLMAGFAELRKRLGGSYPRVFLILGNDDARSEEEAVREAGGGTLWEYAHQRRLDWDRYAVYGYSCVPPTPFLLKDWERFDVSRYVDPGCTSPEEGWRTVPVDPREARSCTIQEDLEKLAGTDDLESGIFLMHSPPYDTALDRAALDGKRVDHAPLDLHVGSIAVRRFIEKRQPLLTLHGHVHESARITGRWREKIGRTWALSAAHEGEELALVRFDPGQPGRAARELL